MATPTETWMDLSIQSVRSVADNEVTARSLFAACRRSRTFREFANFSENSGVPLKKGRETRLNRQYWANMEWWVQFDNFCVRKYAFSQLFPNKTSFWGPVNWGIVLRLFSGYLYSFAYPDCFELFGDKTDRFSHSRRVVLSINTDCTSAGFAEVVFLMPNFWQKTHENSRLRKMLWRHSVLLCAEVTRHVRRSKTCLKKVKKKPGGKWR